VVDDRFEGVLHSGGSEDGDQDAADGASADDHDGVLGRYGAAFSAGADAVHPTGAEAVDAADGAARDAFGAKAAEGDRSAGFELGAGAWGARIWLVVGAGAAWVWVVVGARGGVRLGLG